MDKVLNKIFFTLATLVAINVGLPPQTERRYNQNNLNSVSALGTLATTESNATATGLGSTVEVSGIVGGEMESYIDSQSSPTDPGSSSISSAVNCSEYSTSSASGALSADALASGDCLMNIANSGNHNFQNTKAGQNDKNSIGMQAQVNSLGQQNGNSPVPQEGQITQATAQNTGEGSAEAYQMVSGPQATSAFSGIMGQGQSDVVHGTQETLLTHSPGDTHIQSLVIPFGAVARGSP